MEIQKPNTTYKTARYGCCTFSLILDKRHPKKGKETFPVAMRTLSTASHGTTMSRASIQKNTFPRFAT